MSALDCAKSCSIRASDSSPPVSSFLKDDTHGALTEMSHVGIAHKFLHLQICLGHYAGFALPLVCSILIIDYALTRELK